jgi:hypothetical protein
MNRVESTAAKLVPGTGIGAVKPLEPTTSETPIATFEVFAAAFAVAYAVAHAIGPSSAAEAAAYRQQLTYAELSGSELVRARREALAR